MDTKFKPDPLPQWPGNRVAGGKHLTLWEPSSLVFIQGSLESSLVMRLRKSELDTAAEAVAIILSHMIMGTLGNCKVKPDDGEFFTITWLPDLTSMHDDIPPVIYQFLREYALISPKHNAEVRKIRKWLHNNFTLPF